MTRSKETPVQPPEPTDASPSTLITSLLSTTGVGERSWRSTVAEIIGCDISTARRLLLNQESIKVSQLRLLAKHFGTSVSAMLRAAYPEEGANPDSEAATLQILENSKVPCRVVTRPINLHMAAPLVAVRTDAGLVVELASRISGNTPVAAVVQLELMQESGPPSTPFIVALDDVLPLALVKFLKVQGFDAVACDTVEPVLEMVRSTEKRPDAYVLDWTLQHGTTSLELIREIRRIDSGCPILLLTGTIEANEGSISDAVSLYNLEVNTKPASFRILANRLAALLGQTISVHSPTSL